MVGWRYRSLVSSGCEARDPRGGGGGAYSLGTLVQAVAAVPLLQRLFGVTAEVPFILSLLGYVAPGRGKLQHDAHHLRRFGQRGVDGRREGVDQLRPARVVEPQSAAAEAAKMPRGWAGTRLLVLGIPYPRLEGGYVLLPFHAQGGRVAAKDYGIFPSPGRLAADRAVASLVRVGRGTVARAAKFHCLLLRERTTASAF